MTGVRAASRAHTIHEIKRLALLQLAQHGPSGLSLRAIARDLDMVSSGMYRYYASRDDLLTALIIDAYEALGRAGEQAVHDCSPDADITTRWRAAAGSARHWAQQYPEQWGLIFGTPIPDYRAPDDTVGPASRYTTVLISLLIEREIRLGPIPVAVYEPLRPQLVDFIDRYAIPVDPSTLQAGFTAWIQIVGAITMELFGHFHNVIEPGEQLFAALVETHGQIIAGTNRALPIVQTP